MHENPSTSLVFYRPIEAAIRWAGLLRYEQEILSTISSPRNLPRTLGYPRWDDVLLCMDRIYDAVIHRELPYGQNGVTLNDERSEEQTSELQSLMRIPHAVFCLKKTITPQYNKK